MPQLQFSLHRATVRGGDTLPLPQGVNAVFVLSGMANGKGTGTGFLAEQIHAEETCEFLAFSISDKPPVGAPLAHSVAEVAVPFVVRLDEVAFPPGAVAYRHVHPGPGFRHLRFGHLSLSADEHSFDAQTGDTWFEPANSPVRAEARLESRFVRCMALPPQYLGQSTLRILDPLEVELPRHQVTHRHLDHLIESWPYGDAG